jgi:hypothetical protein
MDTTTIAAIIATVLLAGLILFQLGLAAGLPLGAYAWGGQYEGVLPASLRWASLVAIPILAFAAWAVLARAGLVPPGAESRLMGIAVWVYAAYFTLNTVMNLISKSPSERLVMTPVSLILVICFVIVARS